VFVFSVWEDTMSDFKDAFTEIMGSSSYEEAKRDLPEVLLWIAVGILIVVATFLACYYFYFVVQANYR
jgi:hypothetical protein